MKSLVLPFACLLLASCTYPPSSGPPPAAPALSILHLRGKITHIPANSKWPASIKVGATFDYWAVIDNRVSDSNSSPRQGSYAQKAWPSRYDLKIGDFKFSSDRLTAPTFSVTVYDGMPNSSDGYAINANFHDTFPELPGLEAVQFGASLRTEKQDQITTDQLPIHPIPIADLVGGYAPTFRGYAVDQTDHSGHPFHGDVEKLEVFQASADSPLKLPAH